MNEPIFTARAGSMIAELSIFRAFRASSRRDRSSTTTWRDFDRLVESRGSMAAAISLPWAAVARNGVMTSRMPLLAGAGGLVAVWAATVPGATSHGIISMTAAMVVFRINLHLRGSICMKSSDTPMY